MEPKLTIIVPTFGRSTLWRVIADIKEQVQPGDQMIVAWDGPAPAGMEDALKDFGVELTTLPERVGDFGCTPNDRATKKARGHAIWYLGDDDHYPPGSLDTVRAAVAKQPDVVHIFSMMHTGRKLGRSVKMCEVSSQQAVVPNRPDLPLWRDYPIGGVMVSDFHWIDRCIGLVGRYQFHDEVICIMEQQHYGADL